MKKTGFTLHWDRLKRSWGRRFNEFRLPRGYKRFGTRYGGWWVNTKIITKNPLLIDCGLGEDISFPIEFAKQFPDVQIIGVEPNPRSLSYCYKNLPNKMKIIEKAFWKKSDEKLSFYLPQSQDRLPKGADGVSGSILDSHEYVDGSELLEVSTINLESILSEVGHSDCNILKLDIEGAEYEVLSALTKGCALSKIRQLLVEFHHEVTDHTMADTDASVGRVISCGFNLIYVEGRNYIFERKS